MQEREEKGMVWLEQSACAHCPKQQTRFVVCTEDTGGAAWRQWCHTKLKDCFLGKVSLVAQIVAKLASKAQSGKTGAWAAGFTNASSPQQFLTSCPKLEMRTLVRRRSHGRRQDPHQKNIPDGLKC